MNCTDCGAVLVVGENFTEGRLKARSYTCKDCQYERCKKWRGANPQRTMRNAARQRAKKEGLPFDLNDEDIHIPDVCPVLGIKLEVANGKGHYDDQSPSLDKIIPSLGYVRGNIAVISMRANRIKNNATSSELQRVADWLRALEN